MEKIKLSKRLCAVCDFVEKNARVIDVGTDHAYIPIFLLQNGICAFAAGSDINTGPLEAAKNNAEYYGVSDRLELYLSDGLKTAECEKNNYDCVIICGMGGEMIVSIIENAEWLKNPAVSLILQPMTMQNTLRHYLAANGFEITDETITEDKKYYQIIVCRYTGRTYSLTEAEELFGKINLSRLCTSRETFQYAVSQIELMKRIADGKRKGNEDTSYEEKIINTLTEYTGNKK